jgi:hypothetical protein
MCETAFVPVGPSSFRLTPTESGYLWASDGREVAVAQQRDGRWDVVDVDTGHVAVTLIPAQTADGCKIALIDHRARLVATFAPGDSDRNGLGLLLDSYERLLMAVRADGPTGTHVIDAEGTVLALSAAAGSGSAEIDILLTGAGALRTETLVFGVTLALELVRRGAFTTA